MSQQNDEIYPIIKSSRRRSGISVNSAIFQTVLTLTLSFLVIAEIRAPTLTEEAMERAKLLERVYSLTNQLNETYERLDNIMRLFNVEGVVDPMKWLSSVSRRLKNNELRVLDEITYESAKEMKWLSPRDDLIRIVRDISQAKEENKKSMVQLILKERKSNIEELMNKTICEKTSAPDCRLFEETLLEIEGKAKMFQESSLLEEYVLFAKDASTQPILDWSDFDHKAPDNDVHKAKTEHPGAFATYEGKVRESIPSSDVMPNPKDTEDILTKILDEGFRTICVIIKAEDERLAKHVQSFSDVDILAVKDFYSPDFGQSLVSIRIRERATVPEDVGKVGPRTRESLGNIIPKKFKQERTRLIKEVVKKLQETDWENVKPPDILPTVYDDHEHERKKNRIGEIATKLLISVGLTGLNPIDSDIEKRFKAVAEDKAREIVQAQLQKRDSDIVQIIGNYTPEFTENNDNWLDWNIKEYVTKFIGELLKNEGVKSLTKEHRKLVETRAYEYRQGELDSTIKRTIDVLNKKISKFEKGSDSLPKLQKVIERMGLFDRAREKKR